MSPAVRTSYTSLDGQHVKISKKDLRPMSQEEINIRRSHLQSAHSTRTSAGTYFLAWHWQKGANISILSIVYY